MPIILDPISPPAITPGGEIVNCDSLSVVEVGESRHEGCIINSKTRIAIISKGENAVLKWQIRTRQGQQIDLSGCLACVATTTLEPSPDPTTTEEPCMAHTVRVRFRSPFDSNHNQTIYCADASVLDAEAGLVAFHIPSGVSCYAGIYLMNVSLLNGDGQMIAADSGLLSVETSLWGGWDQSTGPPTINEIRMQLRDSRVENDLLADVEFDDSEIVHSILRPIQQWNETPPPVARFHPGNFPYKYHWTQATCANLLRIAATWYARNHLPSVQGSLRIDDRGKAPDYHKMADQLQAEWMRFIRAKKVEINVQGGFGSTGSPYGGWW